MLILYNDADGWLQRLKVESEDEIPPDITRYAVVPTGPLMVNRQHITPQTAESIFIQTGKRVRDMSDVRKALAETGSRVVEKGDKVHDEMEKARQTRELPKPDMGDYKKAGKILTDHGVFD